MKRTTDTNNNFGRIWTATTAHFTVSLVLEPSYEKYDGDDENGEIQAGLDSGELVMFDSMIEVEFSANGRNLITVGRSYLGSSVYEDGETATFITNGGYFRDMLNEACDEARKHIAAFPKMRAA